MALPAALETIADRLKTFYNENAYDPQQNPGGFARGGNQAGNFIASMRDLADYGKGIAAEFDQSLNATEQQLSESRALANRYEAAVEAIETGPVTSVNGEVGAVTGLLSQTAGDARYPLVSDVYTKTESQNLARFAARRYG